MTLPVLASQACTTASSSDTGICHHCGLDTDTDSQPHHVSTCKFSLRRACKKEIGVFKCTSVQNEIEVRIRTVPLGQALKRFIFIFFSKGLSLSDTREERIMSLNPEQLFLFCPLCFSKPTGCKWYQMPRGKNRNSRKIHVLGKQPSVCISRRPTGHHRPGPVLTPGTPHRRNKGSGHSQHAEGRHHKD